MNSKPISIAIFMLTVGFAGLIHAGNIEVQDAWIREAPPVSKVLAAYMVIKNGTSKDVEVIGASSPNFAKIELHRTVIENGIARMLHQPTLTVPAGGTLVLQPEGPHMMLFNPVKPIQAGEKVPMTLQFASGQSKVVSLDVKKGGGGEHHHHH